MTGAIVLKPPVRGSRPLLGCCSWNRDSYEKQRRDDPKSLRIKSRAPRRATAEEVQAAAPQPAPPGSVSTAVRPPPTGSYWGLRLRARPPGRRSSRGSAPEAAPLLGFGRFRQRSGNGCLRSCGFEKDLENGGG